MKKYVKLISILILPLFLTGCTDEPDTPENEQELDSNDPTLTLVKKNITSSVRYSDYGWEISIKSNLKSAFPGKTIVYGVESGYGSYKYYEHFKFDRSTQTEDGNGNMTISYPVFVGSEYATGYSYWRSYKALKAKKESGYSLRSDEQDLWNTVVKYMNTNESKAKSTFCGRLYAQIDNNRYYFHTFGATPSGSSGSSTGNGGSSGGGSTYKKPEIYYSDFTSYTTSLKVVFSIGNKNRTKVTSAKGYCGSKSVNGTIGSGTITFNFTGLSRGTKYKVYCTADGPGGSATSDAVTLSTLY